MAGRVSQALGVAEEEVTVLFKRSRKQLTALMDGSGKPKLFVRKLEDGALEFNDDEESIGALQAVYFIRTTAEVDQEKSNDSSLNFGELDANPLGHLEAMLTHVYAPLLGSDKVWGKADASQSSEFRAEMGKFAVDLQGALKHLVGGVELRQPDKKFDLDANLTQLELEDEDKAKEMLEHFEGLLVEWCTEIEVCLAVEDSDSDNSKGLVDELEFWRRRMQSLTSITEQLKMREFKAVIGTLSALTKNTGDPNRQRLYNSLRRWKQIDITLTEAANEAKDNRSEEHTSELQSP